MEKTPSEKLKELQDRIIPKEVVFAHFGQIRNHQILDTLRFNMTTDNSGYALILDNQMIYIYYTEHDYEAEERDELGFIQNKLLNKGGFLYKLTNLNTFNDYYLEILDEHGIINLKALNEYKDYIKNQKDKDDAEHRKKVKYEQYLKLKEEFEE